jgi:RNA polymerase sigma factor (sigma-70 family)
MNRVLRHLRRAALLSAGEGPSDAQLLESFLSRRDEAAFEALLRRHGPMVLGVCRRVLRNAHDAEDAFQATFLVLARRAGSIRCRQVVASWLYGVAYRTARKARAMNAKRRAKERRVAETSRPEVPAGEACEELLAHLDQELSRVPDKYRVPVILCELEGKSRKEVALLLGVPEGTLSWRLAQAKKMLARRLSRHGLAISGGALAAVMAPAAASASLRASTVQAALTAGAVPAQVLALTEGVMKAMLLTKLKITACLAALILLAGVGATGLTYRATAQEPEKPAAYRDALNNGGQAGRPQADDLESLRLEIDALRKELRATRERVKALEGQMRALQGQGGMKMRGGAGGGGPGAGTGGGPAGGGPGGGGPAGGGPGGPGPGGTRAGLMQPPSQGQPKGSASDPVADAEAALKKLRQDPSDKEAAEALERALKRLKERKSPRLLPGESAPKR